MSTALPASVLVAAPGGTGKRRISIRALRPYLDTLIPEDATPSATGLGVDKALIALARRNRRRTQLVALGCAWLDAQAERQGADDFVALDERGRESIVGLAEKSATRSLPRTFFDYTRQHAFELYYSQPAAWSGLGFAGPPQPVGFLDYADAPKG